MLKEQMLKKKEAVDDAAKEARFQGANAFERLVRAGQKGDILIAELRDDGVVLVKDFQGGAKARRG